MTSEKPGKVCGDDSRPLALHIKTISSDCQAPIVERGGGRGKNGTHHKCILNEGREEKIEGMSLGLGGRLDGGGRGRGVIPPS